MTEQAKTEPKTSQKAPAKTESKANKDGFVPGQEVTWEDMVRANSARKAKA